MCSNITAMNQLLRTKLYAPAFGPKLVSRPRLIERLHEGLARKLTLIAAPAGFGKSTLVSEWAATAKRSTAWLSLDEEDSDLIRFLTYLVSALQTVAPTLGQGVLPVLQAPQPPQDPAGREALLTALLNDITTLPDPCILVLDDFHLIDTGGPRGAVEAALTFLLDHLPPQLHLVIVTREDPQLPLARLRARGQMTEVRAADLRFTEAEAADFFNRVMGLSLTAADITALENRTEGWIAGLQLAALSMQGQQDVAGFIRAFAGDNRYIVDYLIEEVLHRQPESIRSFLLHTAILDRLNGSLCDAVTGQPGGKERLALLQRGNFFLIPLDDKGHWYRYHHLFADVLAMHLATEQPDQVAVLHQRASEWYEQHGALADAIRHALAAADFARAADLVERAWPGVRRNRQEDVLLGWLKALPAELLHRRPVLSVAYAHVLLATGTIDGVAEWLQRAEQWLDTAADSQPAPSPIGLAQEEFRRLPGTIALARAGLAMAQGDVPQTVTYAQQVLALAPQDDFLTRGGAAGFLGLVAWTNGDLAVAYQTFAAGMASLQKAGNIADAINGAITLAAIRMAQGRLHQALRIYQQGLELATVRPATGAQPVLRGAADMYVGMSEILRERDDLPAAMQQLLTSQELGEHTGFPQNRYRWRVALARLRAAQGDWAGALDLLDEAARLYRSDFAPNVRPIAALRTRVWVAQGRLGEALDWGREQGLSLQDSPSYPREFEHITLARVLLARYQHEADTKHALLEVVALLARLLSAAESGERTGSVIEILIVQALVHQVQGDTRAALRSLHRALILAEPEGYIRIFLDEGPAMRTLITECRMQHPLWPTHLAAYADTLLAAFARGEPETKAPSLSAVRPPLVDPLSERELEVLRLFKTELSGPEIANELVVALSTVRTHTKSIYSKLNVNNRRAAVLRATELALI